MGQAISNLVYPDNKRMRERAQQLQEDCENFVGEFEALQSQYNGLEKNLALSVDSFLVTHGYSSFPALEESLLSTANSDAITQWEDLKETIRISENVDYAILTIEGLIASAGGVTIGALVLAGIVSGPAGWAALGALGTASLVVVIVATIASLVLGKVIQERLKDAISDLFHSRADAQLQVQRLGLMNDFLTSMLVYLNMTGDKDFAYFEGMFEQLQLIGADQRWSIEAAHKALADRDRRRKSFTKYDPHPRGDLIGIIMASNANTKPFKLSPTIPTLSLTRTGDDHIQNISVLDGGSDGDLISQISSMIPQLIQEEASRLRPGDGALSARPNDTMAVPKPGLRGGWNVTAAMASLKTSLVAGSTIKINQ